MTKRQRVEEDETQKNKKQKKSGIDENQTVLLSELPLEIMEEVILFLPFDDRQNMFQTSLELQALIINSNRLIMQLFTSYSRERKYGPGSGSSYFHQADLGGWVVDNYKNYLQEYQYTDPDLRDTNFSELSGFHWATCFRHHGAEVTDAVESCLVESKLLVPFVSAIFKAQCFACASLHFNTDYFKAYSRLGSYNIDAQYRIIDVHTQYGESSDLIKARPLNSLELVLYKHYEGQEKSASMDRPLRTISSTKPLIHSLKEFESKMDELFHLSKWKNLIDWNSFLLVGGSVLRCLLTDSFDDPDQDVDFFFTSSDYYCCWEFYDQFAKKLESLGYNVELEDNNYVRCLSVQFEEGKQTTFQFIWYDDDLSASRILHIFDLDCCQVCYNGSAVQGTFAFVQSINTGTMINYKLISCQKDLFSFMPRTVKYAHRGFQLLVPHAFDSSTIAEFMNKDFLQVKNELKLEDVKSGETVTYTGFLLNNDSFEMRMSFARYLFPGLDENTNNTV